MKLSTGKNIPSDVVLGCIELIIREDMFNQDYKDSISTIMNVSLEKYNLNDDERSEYADLITPVVIKLSAKADKYITDQLQAWWRTVPHE